MIAYLIDQNSIFTRAVQVDPLSALPRCTLTPPPALDGSQVAQWCVDCWVVLPEYPAPPAPSAPSVPARVSMRQARLALLGAGKLAAVSAAINALPSPQKEAAQIEWEYSQEVQRHNGFVSQLAPALGLSPAQLDALFIAAAGL